MAKQDNIFGMLGYDGSDGEDLESIKHSDSVLGMTPIFTVSQTVAVLNQIMETALPSVQVVGEVANFKTNHGKWVFFDLKDDDATLNCFMPIWQLHVAIEDGMKVMVTAKPGIKNWGKFSLTVQKIKPVGEGSIKKSFELLRKKLAAEGLFDPARKRELPYLPQHIGVVSSKDAAGYKDFLKIINARMPGLTIDVISTQVQGDIAPRQMVAAIRQFNELADPPGVLAILRGGGSRDDLMAFDDEELVRTVAASRIPTISGIGHEIDTTLVDLAADLRASTPSNAAELLVPDRREIIEDADGKLSYMVTALENYQTRLRDALDARMMRLTQQVDKLQMTTEKQFETLSRTLQACNPRTILNQGYAIVWDANGKVISNPGTGDKVKIETKSNLITAEVEDVTTK